MTIWKYGSYAHPPSEVNLAKMSISYQLSPRGRRMERIDTLHLYGQFCEDSQADVLTRIDELINAYSFDYVDAGLYLDDGVTLTKHKLVNADSVSGVRVLHRSWDGSPEELATTRTFDIVLQATYPDTETQLVAWQETVEILGTTGPRYDIVDTYFGPLAIQTAAATAQRIVQSGSSVGYSGYVLPPPPLYPTFEHVDRRTVKLGSGKSRGKTATHYPSSWTYYFTLASAQTPVPETR
jgi:hypothetical protein